LCTESSRRKEVISTRYIT